MKIQFGGGKQKILRREKKEKTPQFQKGYWQTRTQTSFSTRSDFIYLFFTIREYFPNKKVEILSKLTYINHEILFNV